MRCWLANIKEAKSNFPPRADGFIGREDILQRINKALSDGSGPRYAVLQGIGSQGKSQVALEYCHRKKDVLTWLFFG